MDYFSTPKNRNDDLEVTGISRSGRVRKKSSKLVDFESPDDLTNHQIKKQKAQHQAQLLQAQERLQKYEQQLQEQDNLKIGSLVQPIRVGFVQQSNYVVQSVKKLERPNVQLNKSIKQEPSTSEDDESSFEDLESKSANETNDINEDDSSDEDDSTMMEDDESESEFIGFTKLEPPEQQTDFTSQTKNSLYMLEKYRKKIIIKDGKVLNHENKLIKTQRKDKGKARFTAYMLWSREARKQLTEQNPNLDFISVSKKLGELWTTIPESEKYNWRKRAQRCADNEQVAENFNAKTSRQFLNKTGPNKIGESSHYNVPPPKKLMRIDHPVQGTKVPVASFSNMIEKDACNDVLFKLGTKPIDVAAHFALLGESLTLIGNRLNNCKGNLSMAGSLPLLLDTLICAVAPLMCLTQLIPEMNGTDPKILTSTMENVTYIMPGL